MKGKTRGDDCSGLVSTLYGKYEATIV